jgi:hypothetical protein
MIIQERYTPTPVGVDATVTLTGPTIGHFLAITAGTITLVDGNNVTLLNAFPVTAGQVVPLLYLITPLGTQAARFTCAGGASGTLGT